METNNNTKSKSMLTKMLNILFYIVIILSVLIVSFRIVFKVSMVYGPSMQPTLNINWDENLRNGDIVYYSNFLFNDYKDGDIIIAKSPSNDLVIKRLIAKQGEWFCFLEIDGKYRLFVNGELVNEEYLSPSETNYTTYDSINTLITNEVIPQECISIKELLYNDTEYLISAITVPQNQIFYLGDNRSDSADCSSYGFRDVKYLVAKVVLIVPYGDNLLSLYWKKIFN